MAILTRRALVPIIAVLSIAMFGFGLVGTATSASADTQNDVVWNQAGSVTICGLCTANLYVAAWPTLFPAPTTLAITPTDTGYLNGTVGGSGVAIGYIPASAISGFGYWFANSFEVNYMRYTGYFDADLLFANGT